MTLAGLRLWADEEKRIQTCLIAALQELIEQVVVKPEDEEIIVSGKLRPLVVIHSRENRLDWTLHPEASIFADETSAKPSGHPDFQFSRRDTEGNQIDYDVECKLVRINRQGKSWDYCEYYVTGGVVDRFVEGKYCRNLPSGTMIGYVQEGKPSKLLSEINKKVKAAGISVIRKAGKWQNQGVTYLTQRLHRKKTPKDFRLTHLWADLR